MSNTFIIIRIKGRRLAIDPGEIVFLRAEGCNTRIFLDNNEEGILTTNPYLMLNVQLSGSVFLQCHKCCLVNSRKIAAFDSNKRTIKVGKHVIQVSRRKSAHIFRHLSVMKIPDIKLVAPTYRKCPFFLIIGCLLEKRSARRKNEPFK